MVNTKFSSDNPRQLRISILSHNLSGNCLGRAYLLAKILQRRHKVEVVGPLVGERIWEPVADNGDLLYKSVKIEGKYVSCAQIKELSQGIEGDVIYAVKPLFNSFGIGLWKKFSKKPLILDIDDWELGFIKENYKDQPSLKKFRYLASSWKDIIMSGFIKFADAITVSNNFLKEKFGGEIIWHARDTDAFDPAKFNKDVIRDKYKIEKYSKVLMFFGTPRPHKGIEDLINATSLVRQKDIILIIVGIAKDKYCRDIVKLAEIVLKDKFKGFGIQPFEKIPEFLAMADLVVIPQKRTFATYGQVPAKVFDAMAMAKPIIATNVSDMPKILDGCGAIVEPENIEELAEKIEWILSHPSEAEEMGLHAREKCVKEYSWNAMEDKLNSIFTNFT